MSTITNFLHGGGTYFSSDIITLLVLFIIFFVYALYLGKNQIISLILAFYPAQLFYEHFPFLNSLLVLKGESMLLLNKIIIFLLFLIPLTILIGRYVFKDSGYGTMHYARMAGYSVAVVILILIFSFSVVSLDGIHNFSPSIDVLFNTKEHLFFWTLAPLGLLFIL